jgi:hypothetical protein
VAGSSAAAAVAVAAPFVHAQKRGGTMRFVAQADLKILDPARFLVLLLSSFP